MSFFFLLLALFFRTIRTWRRVKSRWNAARVIFLWRGRLHPTSRFLEDVLWITSTYKEELNCRLYTSTGEDAQLKIVLVFTLAHVLLSPTAAPSGFHSAFRPGREATTLSTNTFLSRLYKRAFTLFFVASSRVNTGHIWLSYSSLKEPLVIPRKIHNFLATFSFCFPYSRKFSLISFWALHR